MKTTRLLPLLTVFLVWAWQAHGATITVTTVDNANPPAGQKSLLQSLGEIQNGDTIAFGIPGDGPHYILTPAGGYPLVTKTGLTINGYTQPGSAPNSNSILSPNNAVIKVFLDSRNGNARVMDFAGTNPNDDTGYGDSEAAILGFLDTPAIQIRGLGFLGTPITAAGSAAIYGVSFARGASGHVSGCWFGVDANGTTVAGTANGVTGFRYRVRDDENNELEAILVNNLIIGVAPAAEDPKAQFNVFAGHPKIPIIIEGNGSRICGNFLNVLPSGLKDYNPSLDDTLTIPEDETFEGAIEIGRGGNNTVIGVDGDGVNDAQERNIICGVYPARLPRGYDHTIEFYGQNPGTNIVVAGNFIGVGIDGSTRFPNGAPPLNAGGGEAQYRFGSDFDGVSDALEGNRVFNNFPAETFPAADVVQSFFDELSQGATVSLRGNVLVNNFTPPTDPIKTGGDFRNNYYAKALVNVDNGVVPAISLTSTLNRLIGTVPIADGNNYPATIVDLYIVDPEGIALGTEAAFPDLPSGFIQGRTYLGSFVEGSTEDLNAAAGSFEFDLTKIGFGGGNVTITANYVKSPAGTRNAITLTSPFSDPVNIPFTPSGITSIGLTSVVPDTIIYNSGEANLNNWEPYTSVLGTSTFLVEANTFAQGTTDQQRFALAFQPVAGGPHALGDVFFADNLSTPHRGPVNASRQDGNPGRVAGDKRPGAVNFIAGAEASPHVYPEFGSDNRWTLGFDRLADGRYGTVQTFSLNTTTLAQTPLSKAIDVANGRLTQGEADGNQITRFGGELAGLDNGNFAAVVEDRSRVRNPDGNTVAATVLAPDGSIIKDSFVVANGDIWSNLAAHRGGFCVRVAGILYFYDNAGTLLGTTDQNTAVGISFDRGRGDGTRIASHVNSPYVFLAGPAGGVIRVAAWDARTREFAGSADVNELGFTGTFDRAGLAIDALNRVAVVFESLLVEFEHPQATLRVLNFDESSQSFSYLTRSFFPFLNNGKVGVRTERPNVSMTTRQILIAAKGLLNSQNNPTAGVDTPPQTTVYTVIAHANPQEDPTTPIGGGLRIASIRVASPTSVEITWSGGTGPYSVQKKADLSTAGWTTLAENIAGPSTTVNLDASISFLRVVGKSP